MVTKHLSGVLGACALLLLPVMAAAQVAVIPQPLELKAGTGRFKVTAQTPLLAQPGHPKATAAGEILAQTLARSSGLKLEVHDAAGQAAGAIVLTTEGADASLGDEGYELSVTDGGVIIRAPGGAGLFYGVQTLLQLLPPEVYSQTQVAGRVDWSAPAVQIKDKPRFAWRGAMLDVCRHFFAKQDVLRVIDTLANHKINVLHMHLTDDQGWRIEIKKYPKLTQVGAFRSAVGFGFDPKSGDTYGPDGRYGGFYTQDDLREIIKYAADRHMTIVPEIEMPGHSIAALAAYPELSCSGGPFQIPIAGGINEGVYCAGNDQTFAFLQDVLTEVMELFPSPYIHIGGDECPKGPWKHCEKCQARMKAENLKNEEELQSYFVRRIEHFLNEHGKKLIGWDEILEGGLAPNAAVMSWRGIKGGIAAANAGHDVVMTPNTYCYLDHYQSKDPIEPRTIGGFLPLENVYGYEPVPAELTPAQIKHVLGVQGNLWTEFVPNVRQLEYMLWPREAAIAEDGWSTPARENYADFKARLVVDQARLDARGVNYRPVAPDLSQAIRTSTQDPKKVEIQSPFTGGAVIHYTLDGSNPTADSPAYAEPFAIPAGVVQLKVRFFRPNVVATHVTELTFVQGRPGKITASLPGSGHAGNLFQSNKAPKKGDTVTLEFIEPQALHSISIHTGEGKNHLEHGVLEVSADGQKFREVGKIEHDAASSPLEGAPVKAVRMRITEPQAAPLIVREIGIE